ncbi:MAG: hypothetical protein PSV24_06690 [Rhodoferax sp.]|nr:hypothetical protein [Rhodoferax sp.]
MQRDPVPTPLSRMLVLALASALFTSAAHSMSLRELKALEKSHKQGDNYVHYYLVGVMEGALEAHMQDVRNGAPARICLKGRPLEPHMAQSLFDAERLRNAELYEADMPVQLVLTHALTHTYPC